MTGRALITWLAVAGIGCSLQKTGTGADLALGGDTAVDDSIASIETSIEDSTEIDTLMEDTFVPTDDGGDTATADTSDAVVDVAPDAETGSTVTIACSELLAGTDTNLTSEGTAGWAHWGLVDAKSYDHKTGSTVISDLKFTGATPLWFPAFETSASWGDGTPSMSASKTKTGIYITADGTMSFTTTGDGSVQTLRAYVRIFANAAATVTATLGGTNATSTLPVAMVNKTYTCEAKFATSSSVQLDVKKLSGAHIALLSATLQ